MSAALWVGLGGAAGSVLRHWTALTMARWFGDGFPWGTLLVNVVGSVLIGTIAVLDAPDGRFALSPTIRPLVLVGFFGGFTTFSTFSLQTLTMVEQGRWPLAAGYIVASLGLCLVGVWLGSQAGHVLNR